MIRQFVSLIFFLFLFIQTKAQIDSSHFNMLRWRMIGPHGVEEPWLPAEFHLSQMFFISALRMVVFGRLRILGVPGIPFSMSSLQAPLVISWWHLPIQE
ncbi:MAG: hypothetical protein ACJ75B_17360 [Flavisolibacter sp.]